MIPEDRGNASSFSLKWCIRTNCEISVPPDGTHLSKSNKATNIHVEKAVVLAPNATVGENRIHVDIASLTNVTQLAQVAQFRGSRGLMIALWVFLGRILLRQAHSGHSVPEAGMYERLTSASNLGPPNPHISSGGGESGGRLISGHGVAGYGLRAAIGAQSPLSPRTPPGFDRPQPEAREKAGRACKRARMRANKSFSG